LTSTACASLVQVVVFPRQTLFEQSNDVTQLQVSGHEVLGWWVVAREDSRGVGFPTRKMMEGYTELYLHDTLIPVIIMFVLHLKIRNKKNLGGLPFPGKMPPGA